MSKDRKESKEEEVITTKTFVGMALENKKEEFLKALKDFPDAKIDSLYLGNRLLEIKDPPPPLSLIEAVYSRLDSECFLALMEKIGKERFFRIVNAPARRDLIRRKDRMLYREEDLPNLQILCEYENSTLLDKVLSLGPGIVGIIPNGEEFTEFGFKELLRRNRNISQTETEYYIRQFEKYFEICNQPKKIASRDPAFVMQLCTKFLIPLPSPINKTAKKEWMDSHKYIINALHFIAKNATNKSPDFLNYKCDACNILGKISLLINDEELACEYWKEAIFASWPNMRVDPLCTDSLFNKPQLYNLSKSQCDALALTIALIDAEKAISEGVEKPFDPAFYLKLHTEDKVLFCKSEETKEIKEIKETKEIKSLDDEQEAKEKKEAETLKRYQAVANKLKESFLGMQLDFFSTLDEKPKKSFLDIFSSSSSKNSLPGVNLKKQFEALQILSATMVNAQNPSEVITLLRGILDILDPLLKDNARSLSSKQYTLIQIMAFTADKILGIYNNNIIKSEFGLSHRLR